MHIGVNSLLAGVVVRIKPKWNVNVINSSIGSLLIIPVRVKPKWNVNVIFLKLLFLNLVLE